MIILNYSKTNYSKNQLTTMVTPNGSLKLFLSFIGMKLKDGKSHELSFYFGVGTDEQDKIYRDFENKLFDLKEDLNNVCIFHDNYTSGEGIKTYKGYFGMKEPEDAITIKSNNKTSEFRMGSWMKYSDHELFWLQYTNGASSGVLGIIHNISKSEDEFNSFINELSEMTSYENDVFEKSEIPQDKFTYLEWNTEHRNGQLKKKAEKDAEKEAAKIKAEEDKKNKLKEKASKDIELLKNN